MCSKQNIKFKSMRVQHDYRNIWVKNINVNVDLIKESVIQ